MKYDSTHRYEHTDAKDTLYAIQQKSDYRRIFGATENKTYPFNFILTVETHVNIFINQLDSLLKKERSIKPILTLYSENDASESIITINFLTTQNTFE